MPDRIDYEEHGLNPDVARVLEKLGHTLHVREPIGDAQAILVVERDGRSVLTGGSDPRRGGLAKGW
jgi:gamma-glutamyltranspeptidase